MKTMATRYTPKQLSYLCYWEQRGYTFGRDDYIPESTLIQPAKWYMSRWVDLAVTAAALAVVFASLYFK